MTTYVVELGFKMIFTGVGIVWGGFGLVLMGVIFHK